jgi:hypothetical protein
MSSTDNSTWSQLLTLMQHDPGAFWGVVTFFWTCLGVVAGAAYWFRGKLDGIKLDGYEQKMQIAEKQTGFVQNQLEVTKEALNAERVSRAKHEAPEVIEQKSKSTEDALRVVGSANTVLQKAVTRDPETQWKGVMVKRPWWLKPWPDFAEHQKKGLDAFPVESRLPAETDAETDDPPKGK